VAAARQVSLPTKSSLPHNTMATAQELIASGEPRAALSALEQQVRSHASDAKLRVFLFQLLAVMGQWQRALTQLQVCGELDAGTLAMVGTYREAVQCEAVREAVFAGKTLPHVFGRPQAWVAWLAEALAAEGRGEMAAAATLRAQALEAAPATSGSLNGQTFEWIADGDSRLGPVLEAIINGRYGWVPFDAISQVTIEAPTDLRDIVWSPAQLEFPNGGETVALLPTRYVGSAQSGDGALQLARRTEWLELAPDHFSGLGQRLLATNTQELGLLEVREIVLATPAADGDEN
jgi:type VI secretion system protein ImpE